LLLPSRGNDDVDDYFRRKILGMVVVVVVVIAGFGFGCPTVMVVTLCKPSFCNILLIPLTSFLYK